MRGRREVDPELARLVEQRLERLLAERAPRRAHAIETEEEAETDEQSEVGEVEEQLEPEELAAGAERRWPAFTRVHLAVIGVLVLLAVLLGGWAVLRAQPVPLPAVAVPRAGPASPGPSGPVGNPSGTPAHSPVGTPAASRAGSEIVVHVLGAVRRPGLVELAAGARVQDGIDAAGGLRPGARLGDLNLAQLLADGQQLVVGGTKDSSEVRGGPPPGSGAGSGAGPTAGGASAGALLDLNAATAEQLDTLPGVGPVTAAKIIAWREEHERFTRVEELQEVSGIGPKTYAEIARHCRV